MPPETPQSASGRGCAIFGAVAALLVLLLIAISLGWIGPIDRGKVSDLPVMTGNHS